MFDNLTRIEAAAKAKDKEALLPLLEEVMDTYRQAHPLLVAGRDTSGAGKKI
jgi:hypothetical protein